MNKRTILIIVSILVAIMLVAVSYDEGLNAKEKIKPLELHWACMDGCYNSQIVYEIEFNITRDSDRHDKCSLICFERYMENQNV